MASEVDDDFGATGEWVIDDGEIVLEYASESATRQAYDKLKKSYRVYPDEVVSVITEGVMTDDGRIEESLGMKHLRGQLLGTDVTVAVLDTGIDPSDSRFKKNGKSGGRIHAASYDFINDSPKLSDPEGHGNKVAGIVAGNTPDNVSILSCKVLDKANNSNEVKLSTLLLIGSAIRYAEAQGADIINMSLGLRSDSGSSSALDYLNDIIETAYENGIICTVAAGNYSRQITENDYPACLGASVTVGSVDAKGRQSGFSNYGKEIDFVAPGELSEMEGTSAAAPCIAACFAYLKGMNSGDSVSQLIDKLRLLCVDLGDPGKDDRYGWGLPDMTGLVTEHEHQYVKTVKQEATCTESGVAEFRCSEEGCGQSYEKVIPATGPTWRAVSKDNKLGFECINKGCGLVATEEELSGVTPDGFSWEIVNGGLNSSDIPVAHLEISGKGDLAAQSEYPWSEFRDYITTIVLEDSITSVPDEAFAGMKSLGNIVHTDDLGYGVRYTGFSPKLTKIGAKAFFDCDALKQVIIGSGVEQIGAGAFSGCSSLKNISVSGGNADFIAEDGCLYSNGGRQLLLSANSSGIFNSSVTSVSDYAFYGSDISSVNIPGQVSSIGSKAFAECNMLRSVVFSGSSQVTVSEDAFRDVNADVYVPEGSSSFWHESYGGILRWHDANLNEKNVEVIVADSDLVYTGDEIRPSVTVEYKGAMLEEDIDYKLVYSDNVSPGNAEVKIIGTDENYSGIIVRSFTIDKAQFHFKYLDVPDTVHAGEEIPVTYNGTALKDLQEIEIEYGSNPSGMFCTEKDDQNNKVLVARKCGDGVLTVTAAETEFYHADIVKKYQVKVLPCKEDKHQWNEGKVVTAATYTKDGTKRFTCLTCGKTKDTKIARLAGAKVGSSQKVGKFTYKVKSGSAVEMTKAPNAATITVPQTVTINKKKYNVTQLGSKVFYKKSKLKKLTIGSKVTTIGTKACYNCKNLKTIIVKSKGIKKVGTKAFGKVNKKATVKVPKSKVKNYSKLLKKAGLKGKAQKVKAN